MHKKERTQTATPANFFAFGDAYESLGDGLVRVEAVEGVPPGIGVGAAQGVNEVRY